MSDLPATTAADDAVVVILQHGEKDSSPGDPGLTARGRRQVASAAQRLVALDPVDVVSSPLARAQQTAGPVADRCGVTVTIDGRLAERMNLGADDDPAAFFADWLRTVEDRAWTPPTGRSSNAAAADMLAALDERARAGRTIVVASHGGSTSDLLRTVLGDDELERRAPGLMANGIPGGAVTTLRRIAAVWTVDGVAELDHIAEHDRTGHVR